MTQIEKSRIFRDLHRETFILPNAWDVASARIFEDAGFPAIGTSSAGIAFALGYPDGQRIPRGEMLEMISRITQAVDIPVTADIEAGYDVPFFVAGQVWRAGAVGINLEDLTSEDPASHVLLQEQIDKIVAIRASIPELFINARTDIFLAGIGEENLRLLHTIERLNAYRKAGADCLFAPGISEASVIGPLAAAVQGPLNVLATTGSPSLAEMRKLKVARISVGSGPMRATLGLTKRIATELREDGTYVSMTDDAIPYRDVNRLLGRN